MVGLHTLGAGFSARVNYVGLHKTGTQKDDHVHRRVAPCSYFILESAEDHFPGSGGIAIFVCGVDVICM